MDAALLQVRGLRKSFGGVVANATVSIDVPRGGVVGLVGPNGSGKTTLFNAVCGQQRADGGTVHFDGRDISGLPAPRIARLGLARTFQQAHVYARMSCLDNLRASAAESGTPTRHLLARPSPPDAERALELLRFVGLHAQRRVEAGQLSFGQRKLLEFAMALMGRPKLLLLDEPTAGIDPGFVRRVVDRLATAVTAMNVTMLIIEHNLGVLRELAGHLYLLDRGEVVADGPPAEMESALLRLQAARAHA